MRDRRFGMTARHGQAGGSERSREGLGWWERQTQGCLWQPIGKDGFCLPNLIPLKQAHDLEQQALIPSQMPTVRTAHVEAAARRLRDDFEQPLKCWCPALRNSRYGKRTTPIRMYAGGIEVDENAQSQRCNNE
jgi:hypothetical protein